MHKGPCRLLDVVGVEPSALARHLPSPESVQRSDAVDLDVRGGFPEIRALRDRDRIRRYRSYIDSIVERDVAPVAAIRRPDALRRRSLGSDQWCSLVFPHHSCSCSRSRPCPPCWTSCSPALGSTPFSVAATRSGQKCYPCDRNRPRVRTCDLCLRRARGRELPAAKS